MHKFREEVIFMLRGIHEPYVEKKTHLEEDRQELEQDQPKQRKRGVS